ncbi:hypothetical protein [Endozoicomonas euniceicola]|uniref:DUF11 domain-containing protein n=1 Tax=Endozoicomonas euniceicola TaxID=1234143 RepID=A0ABY6GVL0_9GAMM|nr:hypothetical protein [Endozoicomonas euniceicola]UYM16808.1 hypothetical protein NX720_02460 [Endozoicomonas euniceicola]
MKIMLALWLMLLATLAQALTPAGTVIMAQAEVVFFDVKNGQPVTLLSNQSSLAVAPVAAPVLEQNQNQIASPGQQVYFIHRLVNHGNTPDRFKVDAAMVEGKEPVLENLAVYEYKGALPAPDTPPLTETRTLRHDEFIELIVMATVPVAASIDDQFALTVSALSRLDGLTSSENVDTVTVGKGVVRLHAEVDKSRAKADELLTYTIHTQNVGNMQVPGRTLIVDGQEVYGIAIESILPVYTELNPDFTPVISPVQAKVIVFTENREWVSFDRWDKTTPVTRVGAIVHPDQLVIDDKRHLTFSVRIAKDTRKDTLIKQQAFISLDGTSAAKVYSNLVRTTVIADGNEPEDDIIIRFIEPADFTKTPKFTGNFYRAGQYYLKEDSGRPQFDVYLELEGGNFRVSKEVVDTVEVSVRSGLNDNIRVLLQETGSDTGLFRSQSPLRLFRNKQGGGQLCQSDSQQPDYSLPGSQCILQSEQNDTLTATVVDPLTDKRYQHTVDVSPQGRVFDSSNLSMVDGVYINLTDLHGEPAIDLETGQPWQGMVTGEDGQFDYPRLEPGRYFITASAPETFTAEPPYKFPSKVAPEKMPGMVINEASYGYGGMNGDKKPITGIEGSFVVDKHRRLAHFDVPLDPVAAASGLTLEKEAKQKEVAPGELVAYELKVKNNLDVKLYNLQINDRLPLGFKYMKGSARINGKQADDPEGGAGPELTFRIRTNPALDTNGEVTITYALKAGAGGIDGDGINRATATARRDVTGQTVSSNEAKAQVNVAMTGVLSDKGIIFGKLYVDKDCNSLQTPGEWPIGGVRLYMEDGTWVITDENGQYSLMGIRPGQHVLKVDPVTMPDGLTLKPIDNRNAAAGDSRFVDIAPGEMHRADFAAQCPTGDYQTVFDQIKARNESISGEWLLDDAAKYSRSQRSDKADNTGDLSHGVVRAPTNNNDNQKTTDANTASINARSSNTGSEQTNVQSSIKPASIPVPDEAVKQITREQAVNGDWLWPENAQADGRFMAVVRAGVEPLLYVNGEPVSHDRLGEQMLNSREQAQLMAWYGVVLEDGENQVEVKTTDMFGNERILASGIFTQSAAADSIAIKPAAETLAADDGRSLLPVTIKLLDKNGLPARGVYFVTLEASAGRWHETDIQDQEPGHQVRVDQGELTVNLRSGNTSGPVTLRASTGELKSDAQITQVAAPRPLIAAGLVELNAGHGRVNGALSELDSIKNGSSTDARAALFMKGEIAKDTQLTLSYDSKKAKDTELFRDTNPDDYYPITGDASQKGYEAQSRSKLYAKVEKDRSSIMWGDYQTDAHSSEHNLAKIQRNLNGVNAIYDNGDTRIHGFAARPENSHRTETLQPDGTAMNYRLQGAPIERHSETVVLEAFHPDNPGLVINSETMSRGSDYTLDEFSGYLKFSKPIHSRDDKGNVQRIRVSYDLRDGGEAYTVAGVRAEQTINEQMKVGASYTRNEHTTEGSDLSGAWVEYKPSEKTTIAVSAAHMTGKSPVNGSSDKSAVENVSGDAARVKLKHKWNSASETELTWARADEGYKNSASGISSGREETRLKHRQQLTDNTSLRAEAEVSQSLDNNGSSQGDSLGAYLDHKVGDGWKLSVGSRYIRQRNENDNDRYGTGQVGAEKSFKLLEKDASVKAEYEQALTNSRKRFALETNWKVHEKVSAYGRVERDENLSPVASGSDRNQFSVGVKSEWLPKTKTYSEYRMRGATDGKAMEWVNGADTSVTLTKGLTITPSLEVINTVSGKGNNDGVAVSMGVQDKRHANQRATGRIEYRNGKSQNYYGLDAAVARRLNLDWSGLVRTRFRLEQPKAEDASCREKHALTLGLARRPKQDNTQHGLYLYEWKKERGMNAADNRTVHLVSTHQNRQIDKDLTMSGRIGSKWVCTTLEDYQYNSQSWVSDARLTWNLNRRWDLDLRAGVLGVDGTDSLRWSAGAGIYYLVVRNLRVGAYYNVVGFSDKDLDSEKYNAEGVHLSMLFKFDESLFGWFTS